MIYLFITGKLLNALQQMIQFTLRYFVLEVIFLLY